MAGKYGTKVNGSNMLDYIIAFEGGKPTTDDVVELFSYLLRTGQAWTLQGLYGRQAMRLIEAGYLSRDGKILKKIPKGYWYEEDRG
jgi:hypothetical protein